MLGSVFQVGDRFPGASALVRRSLIKVNFEAPAYIRIRGMLDRTHTIYKTPAYEVDCWSHFALKTKPINMLVGCLSETRASAFRKAWSRYNRTLIVIPDEGLERLSDSDLDNQFRSAIAQIEKSK
jgi:hypothetical protein